MNYEVTDFDNDVLERSHSVPVLVDFWAEWCGPCKVFGPILERLAKKSNGRWVLAKLDTDHNQEIAMRYGIRGIPSVKLFVDGQVVDEFTGALPEQAVVRWLETAIPSKFRKDVEKAEQLILQGKVGEGQHLLEGILQQDPGNEHARVLLAGTYLFTEKEKAQELVKDIEEHSEHFPMAEAIRTVVSLFEKIEASKTLPDDAIKQTYLDAIREVSLKNFEGALQKFIDVIRSNRYYDDDGARKACIAIFRILGEENEITRKYRRDFGSALNV